jgi:hypothetical protein
MKEAAMVPVALAFALLCVCVSHAAEEKVLVSVKEDEYNSILYSMNPDGSDVRELFRWAGQVVDGRGRIEYVRISPNGRYVAFTSNHDAYFSPYKRNIFHISSDGSWWDMDTPSAEAGNYTSGAPTGTVTGVVREFGSGHAWVTIEGYPDVITTDAVGNYSVSGVPEGGRFVTAYSLDYGWYDYAPVVVVAGQSTEAPTLTTTKDNWTRGVCIRPAWSRDSDVLYWEARDHSLKSTPLGGGDWTDILPGNPER